VCPVGRVWYPYGVGNVPKLADMEESSTTSAQCKHVYTIQREFPRKYFRPYSELLIVSIGVMSIELNPDEQ
jgi:hypothetical protein